MTQHTVFITGANRGIGFEFVKYYLKEGWRVFAGTRNPEVQHLKELAEKHDDLEIIALDLNDLEGCKKTASTFVEIPIDVFINNAGIYGNDHQSLQEGLDPEVFKKVFHVNAIAPMMMVEYFLPSLERGKLKTIANITSRMGSIEDNDSGDHYAYRASKAALNAIMKSIKIDLKDKGIHVLCLHPGSVKTDMGGPQARITPEHSVAHLTGLIEKAPDLSETFYHYEGKTLPW